RVSQVTPARRLNRAGALAVEFDDLVLPGGTRVPLAGALTSDDPATRRRIDDESRVSGSGNSRTAVFVGAGGALGAVLGSVLGGGKGAAVGGAAGVAVGAAAVLLSKGEEAQVPAGTPFGIQLRQPLQITDVPQSGAPGPPTQADPSYDPSRDPVRPSRDPGQSSRDSDQPSRDPVQPRDPSQPTPAPTPNAGTSGEQDGPPPIAGTAQPDTSADANRDDDKPGVVVENIDQSPPSQQEMVRRAQVALKEQGYYEGASDGVLSPRPTSALKLYQREHKLPETGDVDAATAKSLGITGSPAPQPKPQPPSRPAPQQNDSQGAASSSQTARSLPSDRVPPSGRTA